MAANPVPLVRVCEDRFYILKKKMKSLAKIPATLFFIGYCPFAPGTVGTVAALIVYLVLPEKFVNSSYFFLFPLLLFLPSVYLCGKAEKSMKKDDQRIVLDEFVGYFVSMVFLPKGFWLALIGFILFRFFDIVKIPPVNDLQGLKGGWGIVMDDVMAGIYANLLLQITYFLFIRNLWSC